MSNVGFAQEPIQQKPEKPQALETVTTAAALNAQLKRVQQSFDETRDPIWSRVAFIGTVTDIRPIQATDRLVGALLKGETEVVVVQIRSLRKQDSAGLKGLTKIVIPVGQIRDFWVQVKQQKTDQIFEYNRIGKREFVLKIGC